MQTNNLILESIKTALRDGKASVDLKEAATFNSTGGRTIFDDSFASLRYANPLRVGARQITTIGSDQAFVVKTGNATNSTNPWGYSAQVDNGTPGTATTFWQLPVRDVNAVLPIRTAVLSDIENLDATIVSDLLLEFSTIEAQSMISNNDQSSTTTTSTGGTYGLRGLNSYPSGSTAAFGTNGAAITNGIHTVATVTQGTSSIAYNDIVSLASTLPSQYWNDPSMAWHMHPNTILALRELKDTTNLPIFLDIGEKEGYSVGYIFGHPVIPNPYMDQVGSGKFPIYLAAWDRFLTIVDHPVVSIQRLDQSQPGFINIFAEKRVCSTIRDVFAGVRLTY